MTFLSAMRRPTAKTAVAMSFALLAASGMLLWMHASAVREMREVGLPAAVSLPAIEKRMMILKEQNDIAQLQATLRGGSAEELLRMYIVPKQEEIDRVLGAIDVLVSSLERKRMLSGFSGVEIGEKVSTQSGLYALPLSFEADVTREGLSLFSHFTELSGLLTVGDALSEKDIDSLLSLSENDQPATIASLEHFLSTDLLRYSQDPDAYGEQLRRSFLPAAEAQINSVLQSARLRHARELLGDIAEVLHRENLWPLRLLSLEEARANTLGDGRLHVTFTLRAYVRER